MANARLIAAAPDMIAALRQALWHLGTDADRAALADTGEAWKTDQWQAAALLRDALAKAEGRKQ